MNSMITCYYQYIEESIDIEALAAIINSFPPAIAQKIASYQHIKDRALRANGKILLQELLQHYGLLQQYSLHDLIITEGTKPHFNAGFHFSTSHSGNVTICAGGHSIIGIDIELITDVNINDYRLFLSDNEWKVINSAIDKNIAFYNIWTKKEALLKAIGKGWDYDILIDVSTEQVIYEGTHFFFQPIYISQEYICNMASDKIEKVVVERK